MSLLVNQELSTRCISQIGGDNWVTLMAIAACAGSNRITTVDQEYLATILGITRIAMNRRIKKLVQCKVDGDPLVRIEKVASHNTYHIVTPAIGDIT